ncbi:MAG TPA: bifunctional phosphopantothenoylcysteine decarboxylase/phosphopantothenate--cysteine ligase CoaBC [Aquella sp.]|nr:bifunctional phosphopantothenoylcysteine decarboxylase/phosphopantothenate--cysteine ligase CoaBC [Aquella sp.]
MKKILIGITGSIAAYKVPELLRELIGAGFEVRSVLTESAANFVTPITLQAASGSAVYTVFIDYEAEAGMSHIELARWADIILVAPASANFIAKLANGFCNDLLSTLCLASQVPIIIAPAMNQLMWSNSATQANVDILKQRNIRFIGPDEGIQACGDIGFGRMVEPINIVRELLSINETRMLEVQQNGHKILSGINILITVGSTHEPIDPVRFITNRSSGKMGFALAEEAINLGATVTLVVGYTSAKELGGCAKILKAKTAAEMLQAVENEIDNQDIFISCAAVTDYKVMNASQQKIKRNLGENITLILEPNVDILAKIAREHNVFTVGFAAETENLLENAKNKLKQKAINMIIANDVMNGKIGFDSDFNEVFVISKSDNIKLNQASKSTIAKQMLPLIHKEWKRQAR